MLSHRDLNDDLDFDASRGSAASCAANLLAEHHHFQWSPLVSQPEENSNRSVQQTTEKSSNTVHDEQLKPCKPNDSANFFVVTLG